MSAPYSPTDYASLLSGMPEGSVYIDGSFVKTTDQHAVFGKADGQLITHCGYASSGDLDTAVAAAKAALPAWADKAPAERGKVLPPRGKNGKKLPAKKIAAKAPTKAVNGAAVAKPAATAVIKKVTPKAKAKPKAKPKKTVAAANAR